MAFQKTKDELRELIAEPIRAITVMAAIAVVIATLALIVAIAGRK